jgi:hypothetical protein
MPAADCAASLNRFIGCDGFGAELHASSSKMAAAASQGAQSMLRDKISNMRTSRKPTDRI